MKRPLILLTCFRRFFELERAIERIWEAVSRKEFRVEPLVWVVWAQPEVGRLWFFKDLIARGRVHRLLTRPQLPGEVAGNATSYPESHNLRIGLKEAATLHDVYVIGQASDIVPHFGTYKLVDDKINGEEPHNAVVFHWDNGVAMAGVWHTNFFAVPNNDHRYWPPVSLPDENDVLEAQWGKKLSKLQPPHIFKTHNSGGKKFAHIHSSEKLPPWPIKPQFELQALSLFVAGRKSWLRRAWEWLQRCIQV